MFVDLVWKILSVSWALPLVYFIIYFSKMHQLAPGSIKIVLFLLICLNIGKVLPENLNM